MELRSNPLYLSGAREMVAAVARRLGFSEEACGQIALAVDEALCNVIRHGYDRASDKPIWISLWPMSEAGDQADAGLTEAAGVECCRMASDVGVGAIQIVIEDEAKQVDPSVIKSRNLDEVRPGGLGVHIIRAVMDEVIYEHRVPLGMRLSMLKKRAASTTGASPSGVASGGCTIQCMNQAASGVANGSTSASTGAGSKGVARG